MDQENYRKEYKKEKPKRKVFWKDQGAFSNQRISSWVFGAFLILIGAALVVEMNTDLNLPFLRNWWAIFIMYPGVHLMIGGWQRYRNEGEFFSLFPGAVIFFLGVSFFVGIGVGWVWALFLIFLGFSLILKK